MSFEYRGDRDRARATRPRLGALGGIAVLMAVGFGGCSPDLGDEHALLIDATGIVSGRVFLDVNGDGSDDEPYGTLAVQVLTNGGGVVGADTTSSSGEFAVTDVPVGSYRIAVDETTLPDSLQVFRFFVDRFSLEEGQRFEINFQVGFPTHTLEEVRNLPPGRRVFTQGYALNTRPSAGDGVVHFTLDGTYLRATNVNRVGVSPGDSVRLVGRTATHLGLPILDDVTVFPLVSQAVLLDPVVVSTREATTARSGELDAALVRIEDATITDAVSVSGGLLVIANDGSGPVTLFLREYLDFNEGAIVPDATRFTSALGLLVPVVGGQGGVEWRMTPRGPGDLEIEAIP